MKNLRHFILLASLLVFVSSCEKERNDVEPLYEIGDVVNRGIVFYLDETGGHGLVVASENLVGLYSWGCNLQNISGADDVAIGSGSQNTLDIIAGCNETNTAALASSNVAIQDYTDWYLPSKEELLKMYSNIGQGSEIGNVGGFSDSWYWSSSESNELSAWALGFDNGDMENADKISKLRVRVIRAF